MGNGKRKGSTEKQTALIAGGLIGLLLLTLGIGGGFYFYQAPQTAFEKLRAAASAGDFATIEEYVDFPSLRASVKSYLIDMAVATVESQPEASNPVSRQIIRFGKMVAEAALDPVVEIAVSPLGISALLDGVVPATTGEVRRSETTQPPIIETSFESMDIFVVSIFQGEANRWSMRLFFVRAGLFDWKLAAIRPL